MRSCECCAEYLGGGRWFCRANSEMECGEDERKPLFREKVSCKESNERKAQQERTEGDLRRFRRTDEEQVVERQETV